MHINPASFKNLDYNKSFQFVKEIQIKMKTG